MTQPLVQLVMIHTQENWSYLEVGIKVVNVAGLITFVHATTNLHVAQVENSR